MDSQEISVFPPDCSEALEATRVLFLEYAKSLQIDLCFQDFDQELRQLPGEYRDPRGALLVTSVNGVMAGCCAMRPLDSSDYSNACEI